MALDPLPDPASRIQALFVQFLASREAGEDPDFGALCRDHPAEAEALRKMRDEWHRMQALARLVGETSGSFTARLEQKYREGVGQTVQLDQDPAETPRAATDELVRRLSQRTPTTSRYKLEGEVARGGMGAILKVWDEDLRRHLAMKVVLGRSEPASTGATTPVDENQLARFLEEAQVTGQLDHPGIVPVHELGLDSDGRVYFTMKLVKGRDLKRIFDLVFEEKEGWNETRALSVILKVCEAIAYAHVKGVIHRDLKPANVMVGNFGEVFVMDWGLARVLGNKDCHDIRLKPDFSISIKSVKTERREEREETPDSPLITMDGDVMGTPAYMPPEQARGEVERLTARSDVYAMGAMLYHLLARQMPYVPRGARLSQRTVLGLVVQGPPTPLSTLRKDVPAELVAICERAMGREASERYADTLALAEDLRAYLEHRVVGAYETGTWAETKKWVQRNKPLAAAVAGAVMILVAGVAISTSFGNRANAKAKEAEAARNELKAKNTELEGTNTALARAKTEADQSATAARESATEAKRQKNDVLKLSAFQTLDDLTKRAEALWPAHPKLVAPYQEWMREAEKLMAKVPDFRSSLAEIEKRALPQSDAEHAQERSTHPRAAELQEKRAKSLWMSRMLGQTPWPSEPDVEAELSKETLPASAGALNSRAWPLVDPDKPVYGSEVEALLLARRALAAASDVERGGMHDTLAAAYFKLGRFDEAIAEQKRALEVVEAAKKKEFEVYVERLERGVRSWRGADGKVPDARLQAAQKLALEVADLESEVSKRQEWRFAEDEGGEETGDRWWHDQLVKLVTALDSFGDEETGLMRGVSAAHGWGVARRLEFASSVEERTTSGAEANRRWSDAIATIALSPKYGGLKLTPQLGLLPIGPDPASGLLEFWHVQTGEEPKRGGDGKLILADKMGIVLVLIPGGTFTLGAQKTDVTKANYDENSRSGETPYVVTLDPYFLSKYEMTQGQWQRSWSRNPSFFGPILYSPNWNRAGQAWTALHPVTQVSWTESHVTLQRMGLDFPTESQWERGCRGDRSTAYWSGDDAATLADVGNVADRFAKTNGGASWSVAHAAWDDGNTAHAEVGSYRANDLGLHETHGNVWEWCKDAYGKTDRFRAGDGEREGTSPTSHSIRGGSFANIAADARSASRGANAPEAQSYDLGLRPARAISAR